MKDCKFFKSIHLLFKKPTDSLKEIKEINEQLKKCLECKKLSKWLHSKIIEKACNHLQKILKKSNNMYLNW